MSTNKQRRESERQRLQRQLEERRKREAARRRNTTIASIVGALVLVAAVVVIVVVSTGGSSKKKTAAQPTTPAPTSAATSPASTQAEAPVATPTAACVKATGSATVRYDGLTITGATDLKKSPTVSGKVAADPKTVTCQDLVVGKGAVASTSAQATVEYIGLVAKTGKVFQTSWTSQPATFGLSTGPQGVIAGFSQGIAGAGKIAPMRVGGRRVIVMPADAAYGATPPQNSGIPANATLVFVVDLQKIG